MSAIKKFIHQQATDDLLITNLQRLMEAHTISEAELSRRTQIPQPTLHKILSGKTCDPRISTLKALAECFGVSLDALYTNNVLAYQEMQMQPSGISIPIISWEECLKGPDFMKKLSPSNWERWAVIEYTDSQGMFGLISKPSMEPRFPRGSLLIADANFYPNDGDLAIVQYPNTAEATLREVSIDGPNKFLAPLKEGLPADVWDNAIKILGTVTQSRFSY